MSKRSEQVVFYDEIDKLTSQYYSEGNSAEFQKALRVVQANADAATGRGAVYQRFSVASLMWTVAMQDDNHVAAMKAAEEFMAACPQPPNHPFEAFEGKYLYALALLYDRGSDTGVPALRALLEDALPKLVRTIAMTLQIGLREYCESWEPAEPVPSDLRDLGLNIAERLGWPKYALARITQAASYGDLAESLIKKPRKPRPVDESLTWHSRWGYHSYVITYEKTGDPGACGSQVDRKR